MRPRLVAAGGIALALALGLAACHRERQAPPPAFEVRLLTSAPTSGRWERAAESGLGRIAADLGADVARLRVPSEPERRSTIEELGQAGADLVFCVGPDFGRIVYTEATAYPATRFVLLPGAERGANLAGIEFLPQGAGYLAGVVAGKLSAAPVVGVVRTPGAAWLEDLQNGFLRGFESVHRSARSAVVVGPAGVAELAERGVRIALLAGDEGSGEVLAAAREAGVDLVVTGVGLHGSQPPTVLATVEVDVPEAMLRVAREARDGTFEGHTYTFDLGSGVLDVRLNPRNPATGSPDLREALEVARSEVTAGIIEIESLGM